MMTLVSGDTSKIILIVEDNLEDYETTRRAFRKAGLTNPLVWCSDGDSALDYLHQRGEYQNSGDAPRPSIILLDLNLPGTDGHEVLTDIKQNVNLKTIPVVVLTTSTDPRDIENCYQAGANSYIQKPVNLQGFIDAIGKLKDFWFETAVLPNEEI